MDGRAWWATVHGVDKSRTRLRDFTFTFHFHALEKEMATHSSVLALRIPGAGEPGGLPSMGLHRVGHNWSDLAAGCSLPGSSIHGILQARILEWVAIPFSRGSFQPRDWTQVSCIAGGFLPSESLGKTSSLPIFASYPLLILPNPTQELSPVNIHSWPPYLNQAS